MYFFRTVWIWYYYFTSAVVDTEFGQLTASSSAM